MWFTEGDYQPGRELFRTDRKVWVEAYVSAHRQLLLRAIGQDQPTRLDLLFKVVDERRLRSSYDGLVVRFPTEAEAAELGPGTFVLESGELRDHVSAEGFGWQEGEWSSFGPDALAAMVLPSSFEPYGFERPLEYTPSGPQVPLGQLVDALVLGESPSTVTQEFRYVHTVVVRVTRTMPDGSENRTVMPVAAYLTRREAESALRADLIAKSELVKRAAKPGATVQDTWAAKTLAETRIDRWIMAVPVRL
jgi:hypothetical protein